MLEAKHPGLRCRQVGVWWGLFLAHEGVILLCPHMEEGLGALWGQGH